MQKSENTSRTDQPTSSERSWHPDEIAKLRAWYPKGGYGVLAKILPKRSKSSIYSMANLLELRIRKYDRVFAPVDVDQIAKGLGVSKEMVIQWIDDRELDAKFKEGRHIVTAAALRRWIAVHHNRLDLAQVDRTWFIKLAFPSAQDEVVDAADASVAAAPNLGTFAPEIAEPSTGA